MLENPFGVYVEILAMLFMGKDERASVGMPPRQFLRFLLPSMAIGILKEKNRLNSSAKEKGPYQYFY